VLPQHADDLFFREPALPHESLPGYFLPQSIPTKNGQLFRGQCTVTKLLRAAGRACRIIHSALGRTEATNALREFRQGLVPTLISVDMLNEGIDVPDVNLVVFLRVTHSRRIFIQQLGRGLRLREGKTKVRVLDFVSDIRRLAAGIRMNKEAGDQAHRASARKETVRFPDGHIVSFSNDKALDFFNEYLSDVAAVEDLEEGARLKFPPPIAPVDG
jgi:superfamily II DNA or RNA helicase